MSKKQTITGITDVILALRRFLLVVIENSRFDIFLLKLYACVTYGIIENVEIVWLQNVIDGKKSLCAETQNLFYRKLLL